MSHKQWAGQIPREDQTATQDEKPLLSYLVKQGGDKLPREGSKLPDDGGVETPPKHKTNLKRLGGIYSCPCVVASRYNPNDWRITMNNTTIQLSELKRLNNSAMGNPNWAFISSGGAVYKTKANIGDSYKVSYSLVGQLVDLTLDNKNRVIGIN